MKKLLLMLLILTLVYDVSGARKKDLAGEIDKAVYTDDSYNFSLAIPDSWDHSVKKSKSNVRVIMTMKTYDTPVQFQNAPSFTTVPKVTVYADTTSLALDKFVDSLLSDKFKSKQKKEILSQMPILFENYQLKKKSPITVGDVDGIKMSAQARYTVQVPRAGSESDKADVVTDFHGGSVFFAKQGNNIIMLHFICEWRYFDVLDKDFTALLNGFKFIKQ